MLKNCFFKFILRLLVKSTSKSLNTRREKYHQEFLEQQKEALEKAYNDQVFIAKVWNFIRSKCGKNDKSLTDVLFSDTTEDVFEQLWTGKTLLDDDQHAHLSIQERVRRYTMRTARNNVYDHFNKNKKDDHLSENIERIPSLEEQENSEDKILSDLEVYELLRKRGLEQALEERQFKIINFWLDGMSNQEIANLLDTNYNNATVAIRVAKRSTKNDYMTIRFYDTYGFDMCKRHAEKLALKIGMHQRKFVEYLNILNKI